MVIVELIGSISLIIVLISAILLIIVHIKNRQNSITVIHEQQLNNNKQIDINCQEILHVIKNDGIVSSTPVKYGISWKKSSEILDASSKNILDNSQYEQGDSFSFTDQSISMRNVMPARIDKPLKSSAPYSISNLDVTIPSNLSSTIDLEQFECISTTTSNLSEFLKD